MPPVDGELDISVAARDVHGTGNGDGGLGDGNGHQNNQGNGNGGYGQGNGNGNDLGDTGDSGDPGQTCVDTPILTYQGHSAAECADLEIVCGPEEQVFAADCGCGCEALGDPCGPAVRGEGLYCCNMSCGICVEEGGFCDQNVCD